MKKNPLQSVSPKSSIYRKVLSPVVIVVLALLVLVASGLTWFNYVQTSPDRIFWSAVENNLKTSAFTRHTTEQSGVQTTDQVSETQTSPKQLVHSKVTINYSGGQDVNIVTENLGTPSTDYVRYTNIKTPQTGANGKALDFSKILNVWGKTDASVNGQTSGQQYNESVLSVVPFGSLKSADRTKLVNDMKSGGVYSYHVDSVTHSGWFRRPTYVVSVKVKTTSYINVLKEYARMVGLNQLEQVDASQYASSQPVTVKLTIDGWSHQIRKIDYGEGARVELISGYGDARPAPALPKETISINELQNRLQSVQ